MFKFIITNTRIIYYNILRFIRLFLPVLTKSKKLTYVNSPKGRRKLNLRRISRCI